MSIYQPIRARYELAVNDALAGMSPAIPLYFDNVQEEPLDGGATVEYAQITISFPSSTEPSLCGGVYRITGNVQVNINGPRMSGMRRLEDAAHEVVCALLKINDYPLPLGVVTKVGSIQGPIPILSGNDPQATTVVSAPFTARVFDPDLSYLVACAYCGCVPTPDWECGDIVDDAGNSICSYSDPSLFPPPNAAEYDNADVVPIENFGVTCEVIIDSLT